MTQVTCYATGTKKTQGQFKERTRMKIKNRARTASLKSLLKKLIPSRCILCSLTITTREFREISQPDIPLCELCIDSLPKIITACGLCNTPLQNGNLCGVCIRSQRHWDQCFAAFEYKDSIKHIITEFKYRQKPALGKLLSYLLHQHIINNHDGEMPDYLIPVPMHHSQLKHRGFNQSLILCNTLSKLLNIPTINIIQKQKNIHTQKGLSSTERKKFIKNSFQLNTGAIKKLKTVEKITLIDDVMTTGSTASEIARLLKKSGISTVEAWVLART